MEKTTNFMNSVRTIARKNHFQYMIEIGRAHV